MHQMCIIFCAILSMGTLHLATCIKKDRRQQWIVTPNSPASLHRSGAKYLFTVKSTDVKTNVDATKYKVNKNGKVSLAIQSFEKKTDSGLYTCAAMNNNKLIFGEVKEIKGEPDVAPTDPKPAIVTTVKTECTCKKQDPKPIFNCCDTWILSSLACGFVLLFILLIFTILYCSHLRTSQCHHTCIIQPQTTPANHSKLLDTPL